MAEWHNFERRHVALAGLRAFLTGFLVVALYFVVPVTHHPRGFGILTRLGVGLAFFIAALAYEVRAILRADRPMLRAADAMALLIPLFLVVFSWTYLLMSMSNVRSFGGPLSRAEALYFTVTVFSTVGFGDITAKTDAARLVVTAQMLLDLVVVAVVVRLIFGAARQGRGSPQTS
jgi:voltage-gated potassium channel